MPKEYKERNDKIVEMSETYNLQEIADYFGITRERVRQILNARGVSNRHFTNHNSILANSSSVLGKLSDTEIASMYGVGVGVIYRSRNKKGIGRYKKGIGCPKCKTNHYARGLCKNCWTIAERRGILDKFELNIEFNPSFQKCSYDGCKRIVADQYCWQHQE